jgi:ABC-type nitrate/sulfonate/bicarbonate transport system permease component
MSLLKSPIVPGRTRSSDKLKPPPERQWSGTPIRGILPLILGLVLWQVLGDPSSPYFPPPSEWFDALRPLVEQDKLLPALRETTVTFILGLALATLIGATVGSFVGSSRLADRALGPTLEFLRILPAASLVPIAALILGYNLQMKLVVVVLPALWPILLACRSARRSINPVLLDVPRTLSLGRFESLMKVTVPSMLRPVLLGVRVAAPLALIITILVEIVTRVPGLGALLGAAQSNFDSAQVYGLLLIAGTVGFIVNWVVTRLDFAVSRRMGV